jgi:hypothetical protein
MDAIERFLTENGIDYWNQHTVIPSTEERKRSMHLHHTRPCPHCNNRISLSDAISMVIGQGFNRAVKVQDNDGSIYVMEASHVNPQTMRILDD